MLSTHNIILITYFTELLQVDMFVQHLFHKLLVELLKWWLVKLHFLSQVNSLIYIIYP